jgi:hypothetical protein
MYVGGHRPLAIFFGWIAVMLSAGLIRALMVKRIEFRGQPSIERAANPTLYWQWITVALILDGFTIMGSLALALR